MKTLDDLRKELSPAQRKKIDGRTAQIIAEELTLQGLRKAHHKTQNQVAKTLGMSQIKSRGLSSAAIFCCPPYASSSRAWAASCR